MEKILYREYISKISISKYIDVSKLELNIPYIYVLYEDNHIIVVVKPSGIASQKDENTKVSLLEILKEYVREKYNKKGNVYLGLVHRLDVPTTGIMVFAKTSKAASRLSQEIQKRNIIKKYLVIVKNIVKLNDNKNDDEISSNILRDRLIKNSKLKKSYVVNENTKDLKKAKLAELKYNILEYNYEKNLTLLEVELITGRHHQIRVQFSHRGYPVLHDSKYDKKYNSKELGLYSYYLEFKHPTKDEVLIFNISPKRIDLKLFIDRFNLDNNI